MPLVLYCRIHRFFFSSVWVSGGGGDVVGRGVVGGGVGWCVQQGPVQVGLF